MPTYNPKIRKLQQFIPNGIFKTLTSRQIDLVAKYNERTEFPHFEIIDGHKLLSHDHYLLNILSHKVYLSRSQYFAILIQKLNELLEFPHFGIREGHEVSSHFHYSLIILSQEVYLSGG